MQKKRMTVRLGQTQEISNSGNRYNSHTARRDDVRRSKTKITAKTGRQPPALRYYERGNQVFYSAGQVTLVSQCLQQATRLPANLFSLRHNIHRIPYYDKCSFTTFS